LVLASIALGMAALTLLLAVIGGLRERTQRVIRGLGVNVFGIVQTAPESRPSAPLLGRRQVDYLAANLSDAGVSGLRAFDSSLTGLDHGALVVATDERLLHVRSWPIVAGRGFDPADMTGRSRCAIVSLTLAREMRVAPGGVVRIRNMPFRVIGLADLAGGALNSGAAGPATSMGERVVFVPWTAPAGWLPEVAPSDDRVDGIFIKGEDPAGFEALLRRAGRLLEHPDHAVSAVSWITPRSLVQQLVRLERIVALAGGLVVLLCLALGGMTLTSLLLASVQERIPEIGLRRAIGASRSDIGCLFMGEALALTVAASVIGTGLAGLVLLVGSAWLPVPVWLDPSAFIVPLASALVIGLLSSYGPARAAASMAPAEALRNE